MNGYGFDFLTSVIFDGAHLWVTNGGDSVTELNAADGSFVRLISGSSYHFSTPIADANGGGSVTEVNAETGALVQGRFSRLASTLDRPENDRRFLVCSWVS